MLRDSEVAFLPAPGGDAPPRKIGKAARGLLVSVTLVACAAFGWYGAASHDERAAHAKSFLSMSGLYGAAFRAPEPKEYDQVQYFGFNLFTSPGTGADGCFGVNENASNCYLGSPRIAEDIQHRADIMIKAIQSARAAENVDERPTTLKIFSAPEFYWRGPHGAYRIDTQGRTSEAFVVKQAVAGLRTELMKPAYAHWVFILGTFIMAEKNHEDTEKHDKLSDFMSVTYYNFATVHVGASPQSFVEFKHYISSVDFLTSYVETAENKATIPYPPGTRAKYCEEHPDSLGCVYGHPGPKVMESLGFGTHKPLEKGIFYVGGVKIGLEICLDHRLGKLAEALGPARSVDVHVIVSEGMTIAMGPVCTLAGGPVFLNDGSARTEMSLNQFGTGRRPVKLPDGRVRYELGIAYGADSLVAFQQWLGDNIITWTGEDWGPRAPGEGTLAGGSIVDGSTGIKFHRISALGKDWKQVIDGYYHIDSYEKAQHVYEDLRKAFDDQRDFAWSSEVDVPIIAPSIDIYGPLPLVNRGEF